MERGYFCHTGDRRVVETTRANAGSVSAQETGTGQNKQRAMVQISVSVYKIISKGGAVFQKIERCKQLVKTVKKHIVSQIPLYGTFFLFKKTQTKLTLYVIEEGVNVCTHTVSVCVWRLIAHHTVM